MRISKQELFKEIEIGGVSKEGLLGRLRNADIQFNPYALTLFDHPSFVPPEKPETVKLVKLKLQDLDLMNPLSLQAVIDKALHRGLKTCPLYLGAFLRLNHLDQPEETYLTIISAEPEIDENYPTGFYLRNYDNALWLRGYRAKGEADWPVDHEFIFIK